MPRWSEKLGNSVNFAIEEVPEDTFLKNFFEDRAFVPRNEEEKREFNDFSFVATAMALAVYIALTDEEVSDSEKEQIVKEMIFQVEQYHHEYETLSEEFGNNDKEIVNALFKNFKKEIENGIFDLEYSLRLINKFYEKNPYKKYYLLRLCYKVAFTESKNVAKELDRVDKLAAKLKVADEERQRIRKEIKKEFKIQ